MPYWIIRSIIVNFTAQKSLFVNKNLLLYSDHNSSEKLFWISNFNACIAVKTLKIFI